MKKISSALEAYLNDELNLIELYQDLGCINDHTINTACGDEEGYTNLPFMELRAEQASQQEIIINYNATEHLYVKEQSKGCSFTIYKSNHRLCRWRPKKAIALIIKKDLL